MGQLITPRGKTQEPATEIPSGDIGAVAKLANTHTGDTLASSKETTTTLEPINFPEPCYMVAVFPKSQADLDKMSNALNRVAEEDRTLRVSRDPETAEVLLSGMGEAHLQIVIEGIKRKYGVDLEAREQRISYRETIRKKARANGRHKRQSGGHGQFGDVWLEIEPLPRDSTETFVFEDKLVGGVVPNQFIPGVEKGVKESLRRGFISGNQMLYVTVALVDGKYHPVDSSAQSFEVAASLGIEYHPSRAVGFALAGRKGGNLRAQAGDTAIGSAKLPDHYSASVTYEGIPGAAISASSPPSSSWASGASTSWTAPTAARSSRGRWSTS